MLSDEINALLIFAIVEAITVALPLDTSSNSDCGGDKTNEAVALTGGGVVVGPAVVVGATVVGVAVVTAVVVGVSVVGAAVVGASVGATGQMEALANRITPVIPVWNSQS